MTSSAVQPVVNQFMEASNRLTKTWLDVIPTNYFFISSTASTHSQSWTSHLISYRNKVTESQFSWVSIEEWFIPKTNEIRQIVECGIDRGSSWNEARNLSSKHLRSHGDSLLIACWECYFSEGDDKRWNVRSTLYFFLSWRWRSWTSSSHLVRR